MKYRTRATWILALLIIALCVVAMLTNNAGFDLWANTGVWSILPPLAAVFLTLASGNLLLSLLGAVLVGAFLCSLDFLFLPKALLDAGMLTVATFRDVVIAPQNAGMLVLIASFGGLAALIVSNGGAHALATFAARRFRGPAGVQIAGILIGLATSFDGAAHALISGPILRPMADRHLLSREKTAFLLDATAAPAAGFLPIFTGLGLVFAQLQAGIAQAEAGGVTALSLFLQAIPYCFYPVALLALTAASAASLRDFGPMRKAEIRARAGMPAKMDGAEPDVEQSLFLLGGQRPASVLNAIVPLAVLLVFAFVGLYASGYSALMASGSADWLADRPFSLQALRECFYAADGYIALLPGVILASLTAYILGAVQRRFTLGEGTRAWLAGVSAMASAAVTLVLAWSLAAMMQTLGAGEFLLSVLPEGIPVFLLPSLAFLLASAVSFVMGGMQGAIALLIPILLPMAMEMLPEGRGVWAAILAGILGGAALGGHCSPMHTNTILSAAAAGCSLRAHWTTQAPYALLAGAVALLLGYLPVGLGLPALAALPITALATIGLVFALGRRVPPTLDAPTGRRRKEG